MENIFMSLERAEELCALAAAGVADELVDELVHPSDLAHARIVVDLAIRADIEKNAEPGNGPGIIEREKL